MAAESKLEEALREVAEDRGLMFLKFTSPNMKGFPAKMVLEGGGKVTFVIIRRNNRLSPGQVRIRDKLGSLGHHVFVVSSEQVKEAKMELEDRGCIYVDRSAIRGFPDRPIIGPGGKLVLMELKAPDGRLSPSQVRVQQRLKSLGHQVYTVWSREQGVKIIESI